MIDGQPEATRYVSPAAYEHYLRAKLLLERGDSAAGVQELRRALALDDTSPYLHCELAIALSVSGQLAEARRLVRRAIALKPDFPPAVSLNADLLHRAGQRQSAERAYLRCIELAPDGPRCYRGYAALLQQDGRDSAARRVLGELVRASGGAHGRHLLAEVCLQQLDLDCAATQYEQLASALTDTRALLLLARVERARGRTDAAVALLQQPRGAADIADDRTLALLTALAAQEKTEPLDDLTARLVRRAGDTRVRASAARVLLRAGRYTHAAQLAAVPTRSTLELRILHARALLRMGRKKRSDRLLAQLLAAERTADETLELSELLIDRGELRQALDLLRPLARQRPRDELVTAQLAHALILANDARQAARVLRDALAKQPKSTRLMLALAVALDRLGDWQQAVALSRQAADAEPENAAAHNAIGFILADRGERLDEAERAVRRAMRLEPLEPYIIDSLAWVLRARGRLLEARRALELAVRIDGRDPELLAHLARVRSEMGSITGAIKLLRTALSICQDDLLRSRWKRQLEQLKAARVGTADH